MSCAFAHLAQSLIGITPSGLLYRAIGIHIAGCGKIRGLAYCPSSLKCWLPAFNPNFIAARACHTSARAQFDLELGSPANGNRSQAAYSNFGGAGGLNSLTRNFTLNPSHNKVLAVTDTSQTTSGNETSTRTLSWDASGKLLSDSESTFTRDPATSLLSAHGVSDGRPPAGRMASQQSGRQPTGQCGCSE